MSPMTPQPLPTQRVLLALAATVTAMAYALALSGPFVLDDHVNLAPVWAWLGGQHSAWDATTGNASGPLGRPLAYASFMANAALGGASPFGFKLANLALHLLAGALALLLLRRALAAEPRLAALPAAAAALLAIWWLHPLQASTVLYVVQRMALLGAIAQLGAVLVYLHGRELLAREPARARLVLFVAFPACVALGLLAKETAALAPLLALGVEMALYRGRRVREVRLFFAAFLLLPALLAIAALAAMPERFVGGYAGREFDLAQRLLTQPRVLLDYLLALLWPSDAHLGLYRDGYPHSTGLFAPAATALALSGWAALAAVAWWLRRRLPLFFLGVFWFLAGHALEAGFFPLEPYFEHRNYLPSLGIWLALCGLLAPLAGRVPKRAAMAIVVLLPLGLAALTVQRTIHWADLDTLLASEGPPPGELSRRHQIDLAIRGYETGRAAQTDAALAVLEAGNPGDRAAAALWRAVFACDRDGGVDATQRAAVRANLPPVITHSHVSWLQLLARRAHAGRCPGLDRSDVAALADAWLAAAAKPVPPSTRKRVDAMRATLADTGDTP